MGKKSHFFLELWMENSTAYHSNSRICNLRPLKSSSFQGMFLCVVSKPPDFFCKNLACPEKLKRNSNVRISWVSSSFHIWHRVLPFLSYLVTLFTSLDFTESSKQDCELNFLFHNKCEDKICQVSAIGTIETCGWPTCQKSRVLLYSFTSKWL